MLPLKNKNGFVEEKPTETILPTETPMETLSPTNVPTITSEIIPPSKLPSRNSESHDAEYIGTFKLTAYCPCYSCSEGYGTKTSTGVKAKEGVTIAVDPKIIPYGTKVYIEGVGERIAQDCGGAVKNKKIDIYVNNHSDTTKTIYNQKEAKVRIIKD